jgi:hypothetical protein
LLYGKVVIANNAEGRMTYKLTITVTHHSNGESTVTQNLHDRS